MILFTFIEDIATLRLGYIMNLLITSLYRSNEVTSKYFIKLYLTVKFPKVKIVTMKVNDNFVIT